MKFSRRAAPSRIDESQVQRCLSSWLLGMIIQVERNMYLCLFILYKRMLIQVNSIQKIGPNVGGGRSFARLR